MLTLADLRGHPARLSELAGADALVAASSDAEVLLREAPGTPEATVVFQHETIAMMRAERASEIQKLKNQTSLKSAVIAIRKKPGSFWDQITVGRASTNDIVLGDPAVSNVHAHFEVSSDGSVSLQDLGSSNGTYVNREPLQPHVLIPLHEGDCVRFGQSVFYYVKNVVVGELAK
jgi:hypothetical protein